MIGCVILSCATVSEFFLSLTCPLTTGVGIGDSGKTTEAATSQWRAWRIGNHDGGVNRGRWSQGPDNDNGVVGRGKINDNALEWTSLTEETRVCLQVQVIDNDKGVVVKVIRACRLSNNDEDIGRRQGIDNVSEVLETMTEASRIRGRRRRLRRRVDRTAELATTTETSKDEDDHEVSTTTTEASAEESEKTLV